MIQPPNLQAELYACLDEVKRRKPWLTHKKPEPWAALVMSDNTRNFYGRMAGPGRGAVHGQRLRRVSRGGRRASPLTRDQRLEPEPADLARVQGPDPGEHRMPR